MSRYSPTVLPNYGDGLADALVQGVGSYLQARKQKTAEDQQRLDQNIARTKQGYRPGTPPEQPPIDGGAAMAHPYMQELSKQLMAGMPSPKAAAPAPSSPTGPSLASAIQQVPSSQGQAASTGQVSDTTPGLPAPTAIPAAAPSAAPTVPGRATGAFDPSTGDFGQPTQHDIERRAHLSEILKASMIPPSQRYTPVPGGGYIDQSQTPEAMAQARDQSKMTFDQRLKEGDPLHVAQTKDAIALAGTREDKTASNQKAYGALKSAGVVSEDYNPGQDYTLAQRTYEASQAAHAKTTESIRANAAKAASVMTQFVTPQGVKLMSVADGARQGFQPAQPKGGYATYVTPSGLRTVSVIDAMQNGFTPYEKPAAAGGGSGGFGSQGVVGTGRALAAINGLDNANEQMKAFEKQVHDGKAQVDGMDYFQTQMGKMYDAKGVMDQGLHAAVLAHLDDVNPELGNYLQQAEFWALEESNLTNRPSDFRTKLDGFVSALKPNMSQKQIESLWLSRDTRMEGWHKTVPAIQAMLDKASGASSAAPAAGTPAKSPPTSQAGQPATKPPAVVNPWRSAGNPPGTGAAPAAAGPPGASPTASPPAPDDFRDDELANAHEAGGGQWNDDQIRDFIQQQRSAPAGATR